MSTALCATLPFLAHCSGPSRVLGEFAEVEPHTRPLTEG